MTDLVAHQGAAPMPAVADAVAHYDLLERQCVTLAGAQDAIPRSYRGSPAKILLAAMAGARHGWNPVEAMLNIDIVEGKPRYTAEVLNALIRAAGHRVTIDQAEGTCTVTITRADTGEQHSATWTDQDAARAGLAGKDNWRKYGRRMLMWRALYDAATWIAPDVTRGLAGVGVDADPEPVAPHAEPEQPRAVPLDGDDAPVDAELVDDTPDGHPADTADANDWIAHCGAHGVRLVDLRGAPLPNGLPTKVTNFRGAAALPAGDRRHLWAWVAAHASDTPADPGTLPLDGEVS